MSPAPKYQAVLFDLDGTLLDTAPDFVTAINRLLTRKGLPIPNPEKTRRMVSYGSVGMVSSAFDLDAEHPDFEPLRQEFLTLYLNNIVDRTQLFPGIESLLDSLEKHHIPWGIVTNKPSLYTHAILEQLPLPSSPSAVICPDDVTHRKPDPESIYLACNQLQVDAQQCLVIGDHIRDVQAGLNAGSTTIAAAYGYLDPDEDPHAWGAHQVVTSAADIAQYIFE